jgi:hypothetical protein
MENTTVYMVYEIMKFVMSVDVMTKFEARETAPAIG